MLPSLSFVLGCVHLLMTLTDAETSDANVCNVENNDCKVIHEWVTMEYLWPDNDTENEYVADGRYNRTHCLLSGVKLYKGEIYVTIPRIRYYYGVPSTLNKVVVDPADGKAKLEPFPNWEIQQQGTNCDNLQMAMSIEIDPQTGYLYVIDPGRPGVVGTPESGVNEPHKCPPKLVIFDINSKTKVNSYTLPSSVASKETNFLNDIVLDRGDPSSKTVRWVYITDALDSKLYVVDLDKNQIRNISHPSMDYEPEESVIEVNGKNYTLSLPIDGMAMSSDFKYVYYCALGSLKLWRVPTFVLRDSEKNFGDYMFLTGDKISQTGGMIYAQNNIYYGGLSKNAVYKWSVSDDMKKQGVDESKVKIETETEIVGDDSKLIWPDAFAIDDEGYMYFSACRANLFLKGGMDFSGGDGPNFRIWRVKIGERGYLADSNGGNSLTYRFFGVITLLLSLPLSRLIHSVGTAPS